VPTVLAAFAGGSGGGSRRGGKGFLGQEDYSKGLTAALIKDKDIIQAEDHKKQAEMFRCNPWL
jgi:hypothetical protein